MSEAEARLLASAAAPIVLLRPLAGARVAAGVAKSSPYLGVMLPYSPLHHLLMRELRFAVVATSGNRSDEPIATANEEALERLGGIADAFLMHDRPVARPVDDSVVRVARGRENVIRRARGYAPLPVRVGRKLRPVLAVGGHLKNTVAIAVDRQVFVSQHVGDLDTLEARGAFERAIADLCRLYRFEPEAVVCDLHPDYASTRWAEASGLPKWCACSTIMRTWRAARRRTTCAGRISAWRGTAPATDSTARCGAASSSWRRRGGSSASRIRARSGCRAAKRPCGKAGARRRA